MKIFCRIPYREALSIVQRHSKRLKTYSPTWGDDFNTDHENCLMEVFDNVPIFITDFPNESKPFYMYENSDNATVSWLCFVLIKSNKWFEYCDVFHFYALLLPSAEDMGNDKCL